MEKAALMEKPRVRVPAGSRAMAPAGAAVESRTGRAHAGYMRDTRSGVIAARPASLEQHRDQVRRVWRRAAALAIDLIQNSGRLRGVVDQIIADTVGVELSINLNPDLSAFGYDQKEASDFVKIAKHRYRLWCWDANECSINGKFNIPQQTDISIRNWLAFGESCGLVDYMPPQQRRRYGIRTGTKYTVVSPDRLVQETNEGIGLYQGVFHDANGRVEKYRFSHRKNGIVTTDDFSARDADGRQLVVHVFDPFAAEDVRGISPLASTFRKYLMGENVDDATAQMQFLQTIYALTLTSELPSKDAFESLQQLGTEIEADVKDYMMARFEAAAEGEIKVGSDPVVSNLAPGEKLTFETAKVPGTTYSPFRAAIDRETARALGVSYGGYTMDYEKATYASTNMENASLHPLAVRRTDRIAAPNYLVPFQSWMDEEIGEGRIPFKAGYDVFKMHREEICWATCLGPPKTTADDEKAAKAASERILNGTGTLEEECAAGGRDAEEVFASRLYWHKRYTDEGMPSPFARKMGSEPSNTAANAASAQGEAA